MKLFYEWHGVVLAVTYTPPSELHGPTPTISDIRLTIGGLSVGPDILPLLDDMLVQLAPDEVVPFLNLVVDQAAAKPLRSK